jgi:predicted NUDIX family NTP pyrophosphohydrolase
MQRVDNPNIVNRAGLIPFYVNEHNDIVMLFMVPTDNEWIDSVPQISKGRLEQDEMLLKAAIREAKEELGLKSSNLIRIEPIGQYSTIMFYVGQINNPVDFDPFDTTETQKTVWLTLEQYQEEGRALHLPVVIDAVNLAKEMNDVVERDQ